MIVWANLDCEATWAGVTLPASVVRKISAAGVLLAALAPGAEIWTPAEVDPARLVGLRATLRSGIPARCDLAWADPAAKPVNDRRFALALAQSLGIALTGARAIDSLAALDAHVAALGGRWVGKAVWTAAGRDRCFGAGPPEGELRTRASRLIARPGGIVVEPWLDRICDVGQCADVAADGAVALLPPHRLVVGERGAFSGIELTDPPLEAAERELLANTATSAGAALARGGYAGPFTVDAFAYRDGTTRRFHPLCELNARLTFGRIAHALGGSLGFGPPPAGAHILIAPAVDDATTAWTRRS